MEMEVFWAKKIWRGGDGDGWYYIYSNPTRRYNFLHFINLKIDRTVPVHT